MEKQILIFLPNEKKSKIVKLDEEEWEIMIPYGMYKEFPNGKTIDFIKESELGNYKKLGVAAGLNFKHAVILGREHCENFFIRLSGYHFVKNDWIVEGLQSQTGNQYVSVAFYENKH